MREKIARLKRGDRFYFDFSSKADPERKPPQEAQNYQIAIFINPGTDEDRYPGIAYRVRATVASGPFDGCGQPCYQERFIETRIPAQAQGAVLGDIEGYRILNISVIRRKFLAKFETMP